MSAKFKQNPLTDEYWDGVIRTANENCDPVGNQWYGRATTKVCNVIAHETYAGEIHYHLFDSADRTNQVWDRLAQHLEYKNDKSLAEDEKIRRGRKQARITQKWLDTLVANLMLYAIACNDKRISARLEACADDVATKKAPTKKGHAFYFAD